MYKYKLSVQLVNSIDFGFNYLQCDVCEIQCTDSVSLDEHRAVAGHYKCRYSTECASFIYSTQAELLAHQQTVHGLVNPSPVQQLAHQVTIVVLSVHERWSISELRFSIFGYKCASGSVDSNEILRSTHSS